MKRRSFIPTFLITAASLVSFLITPGIFAAPPSPDVQLTLDEISLLPGTPTGVSVAVTNAGDHVLQLPASLCLTATRESGETFTLRASQASDGAAANVPPDVRTIPAHASRELRFDPVFFLLGSPWFLDDRLTPGHYRIHAVFAPIVNPDGTFDPANAIASNELSLTVEAASDEDRAVWKWMMQTGNGKWGEREWSKHYKEFGAFVAAKHPSSRYALFAAVFQPHANGEAPQMLEEQVRRFPGHSFSDQAKLLLMQIHQQGMTTARLQSDTQRAASEADEARELASDLVKASRSSLVRTSAKDFLGRMPTREQLMEKPMAH